MKKEIKFITEPFKHKVQCFLKDNGYDIYLNNQCIKTCANRIDIQMLYKILENKNL
tara:strand:+ start:494 stop:661 length:168 start_codon:yes stop_codon:yes gene_type:complete